MISSIISGGSAMISASNIYNAYTSNPYISCPIIRAYEVISGESYIRYDSPIEYK